MHPQAFQLDHTTQRKMTTYLFFALMVLVAFYAPHAHASTGTEFQAATQKFSGWVLGNLGKLSALICVAVGIIVAAIRKDWSWLGGAVILAMGVGIIVGIIDASFAAVI